MSTRSESAGHDTGRRHHHHRHHRSGYCHPRFPTRHALQADVNKLFNRKSSYPPPVSSSFRLPFSALRRRGDGRVAACTQHVFAMVAGEPRLEAFGKGHEVVGVASVEFDRRVHARAAARTSCLTNSDP